MFIFESTMPNIFPSQYKPLPLLVMINSKLEYEISQIIDSEIDYRCICKLLYRVIWLRYENTKDESD